MVVAVVWLLLATAHVPLLVDAALLPCFLLPALISPRARLAREPGILGWFRFACALGPLIVIHLRNPAYFDTVRGTPAPPWLTDVPTRAQVWGQIAATELLLLLALETLTLGTVWALGRRRAAHQSKAPRGLSDPGPPIPPGP